MRILLVEDEENIREVVKLNLELEEYEVITSDNGKDALKKIEEQHFDLLVLDVMLPDVDGFQICEQVRLSNMDVPIIFLTAKDTSLDRINGLKKGADDYLTKPFHLEELLLRVNNLIKRSSKSPENTPKVYTFGKNKINFITFEAETADMMFILRLERLIISSFLLENISKKIRENLNTFYLSEEWVINLTHYN